MTTEELLALVGRTITEVYPPVGAGAGPIVELVLDDGSWLIVELCSAGGPDRPRQEADV